MRTELLGYTAEQGPADDGDESLDTTWSGEEIAKLRAELAVQKQLLIDIGRWRRAGTSLPKKIEAFGSIGDYNVFAVELWKRYDAWSQA